MAEAQLQQFLEKVRQLNAFVALSEADPALRRELRDCADHDQVVSLARRCGFEIGRRWGEGPREDSPAAPPRPALAATSRSLLQGTCPAAGEEQTTVLLQTDRLRLERIHSCSASSPQGFWYDQTEHEWLVLLQGSARLHFAYETAERQLICGESLWIPPHRRHRLAATDPAPGTIWLALFWHDA